MNSGQHMQKKEIVKRKMKSKNDENGNKDKKED